MAGAFRGLVLAALVLLALPATSAAAVTCSRSGSTLTVSGGSGPGPGVGPHTVLGRSGTAIQVSQFGQTTPVTCTGSPTVSNTDAINYVDSAPVSTFASLTIDQTGGSFAPGAGIEAGAPEIEITVDSGTSLFSVTVKGLTTGDAIRAGTAGINLNAGSEMLNGPQDVDISGDGVLSPQIEGGGGNDSISADGGPGTGGAVYSRLFGGDGDDALTAGSPGSALEGGPGDDALTGAGGQDYANYLSASSGVTVNLGMSGPQNTGGAGTDTLASIDLMLASPGDDVLTGGPGANVIFGMAGNDTIDGAGGNDQLNGEAGTDTVSYASVSGSGVDVNLGVNPTAGGGGADTLSGFENLIGSPVGDKLTGNDAPNTITGLGGNDEMSGLNGADVFNAQDGAMDTISCGLADDTVNADVMGTDTIGADCELVNFTDVTPPETTLTAGPEGPTVQTDPAFFFGSDDAAATFECSLDSVEFAACTSPVQTSSLADGPHTFSVRARDPVGNVDATPATRSFTVDTTPPDTAISGGAPTFTLQSEEGATFECKLDDTEYAPCASPFTIPSLANGLHTISVRARDAVGNTDPTPASLEFRVGSRVGSLPPLLGKLRVGGNRVKFSLSQKATVTFTLERKAKGRWKKLRGKQKAKAKKGRNSIRLKRAWRPKQLARGKYRLSAVANNKSGKSKRRRATFRDRTR